MERIWVGMWVFFFSSKGIVWLVLQMAWDVIGESQGGYLNQIDFDEKRN